VLVIDVPQTKLQPGEKKSDPLLDLIVDYSHIPNTQIYINFCIYLVCALSCQVLFLGGTSIAIVSLRGSTLRFIIKAPESAWTE
jgi:hypothetical protein